MHHKLQAKKNATTGPSTHAHGPSTERGAGQGKNKTGDLNRLKSKFTNLVVSVLVYSCLLVVGVIIIVIVGVAAAADVVLAAGVLSLLLPLFTPRFTPKKYPCLFMDMRVPVAVPLMNDIH